MREWQLWRSLSRENTALGSCFFKEMTPLCPLLSLSALSRDDTALSVAFCFFQRYYAALSFALSVSLSPSLQRRRRFFGFKSCFVRWFHWREEAAFVFAFSFALI
jgi:hypothetical protein